MLGKVSRYIDSKEWRKKPVQTALQ